MTHRGTLQDPDFAARVRASFAQQGLMSTLGASLQLVEPGEVHIALPFSPALSQQHGYMHAGATTAIADSANGYAALTLTPPGYEVLAVEFKINLLAPAKAPQLLACGRVLRAGRRLIVCLAEVFGIDGVEQELVAAMLSTISARPSGASSRAAVTGER
jgi:uncharacterized protein (TIGR00369 family)